jgi:hypothetical protein
MLLAQEEHSLGIGLWFNMDDRIVSENYIIDGDIYIPILIDEASIKDGDESFTFKVLADHKSIGWVLPIDDEFNLENIKPFTTDYYMDIIVNSEFFTEIAVYLYTKDNIHFSLKPYKYKDKFIIFQ